MPDRIPRMVVMGTTCHHTFREHIALHSCHHQNALEIADFPEGGAGIAAVLFAQPQWTSSCLPTTVQDGAFRAIYRDDATLLRFGSSERVIARVTDSHGRQIFVTPCIGMERLFDAFQLLRLVEQLRSDLHVVQSRAGIVLPMIVLDALCYPEWIHGLQIIGSESTISVSMALLHTRLTIGTRVARDVEILDEVRADHEADRSFSTPLILWIEEHGLTHPFLSALILEDALVRAPRN
jgi:hypothetical protein